MNPATAFAAVLVDELIRCGLREAVVAPGSRSTPLALALWERSQSGALRLHVRIDERSAAFLALGLAKAGGRPAMVVCTSGTAAAHFHAAVVEADEARVPLLVVTADRPPELRGTGANQAIDQLKMYGGAVRWFCETGVAQACPGMNAYWRSMACRAWAAALGAAGGLPGPVHVNVPLREPLVPHLPVPHLPDTAEGAGAGEGGGDAGAGGDSGEWPEPLDGRPDGAPWTSFGAAVPALAPLSAAKTLITARNAAVGEVAGSSMYGYGQTFVHPGTSIMVPWTERGLVVCGDGCSDPAALERLAAEAGWPLLAEPSSGARRGSNALSAYPYLLASAEFMAAHQPDLIVSGGRPGLSRPQLALLKGNGQAMRHVVIADGPGWWADPARSATDVAAAVRLDGRDDSWGSGVGRQGGGSRVAGGGEWLASWLAADRVARQAVNAVLDSAAGVTEPRLARDVASLLPVGALLWVASSLPIRDLDHHMAPRDGLHVLASRGASGIDGLTSSAIGAALAHQAAGGGPAVALLGDLAFLHDLPGLVLGPEEPRPDLTLVVVNNNGGGIFSLLEQADLGGAFERLFGTPHDADLQALAAGAGVPSQRLSDAASIKDALAGDGLRVVEARTDRAEGAALRAQLTRACSAALARLS
ncbi:MAG TPA: 2-succinyl-5-enolpyruvyl-6-hydroxy-3-cyclohexene-1-carboxylic-acid synthase [Streptosporangiaceae bacterium]|nr:2-succinyl-5-enolpyruvyl-6-hydroxy-3-cyclohexene-1-carboxylic-acid synthase [Streptosporangiaceae bacterium]